MKIGKDMLSSLFTEVYEKFPDVSVFITYSKLGEKLRPALSCGETLKAISDEKYSILLGIYRKSMKGYLHSEKLKLNEKECGGNTFRERLSGWGLIGLNINHKKSFVEVNCSVNSEKRASAWFSNYPEFKSPELWDWIVVRKTFISLNKILKKYSLKE